jgi:hypothetical protein
MKSVLVSMLALIATAASADVRLDGGYGQSANNAPGPVDPPCEDLFRGDLTVELDIGCSNPTGTSGGPNDLAQGVTANLVPPFFLTSVFYNVGSVVSPNINQLDFVIWKSSGGLPGAELFRHDVSPNWGDAEYTIPLPNPYLDSAQFFFGLNQNQTNVGFRVGVDSSSGSWGQSYIRAPTCGVGNFVLLDSLGFPGNWVMAVTACQAAPVPVELASWGSLKVQFR